jgi:hypothetical protein
MIGTTAPYGSIALLLYQDGDFEVAGSAIIDGTTYFQVELAVDSSIVIMIQALYNGIFSMLLLHSSKKTNA